MKQWKPAALAAIMCLCLCACGKTAQPEIADDADLQTMAPVIDENAASESDAQALFREAPASDSDTAPPEEAASPADSEASADERFELAQSYIGRSAEELIAALGEPEDAQYASSCEAENAEDGMLFYDGFYIWTLKTDESELVRDVYPDE